jgi:precorrin-6B methylase 2
MRPAPDNSEYWDGRAASFAKTAGQSSYAQSFFELLRLQPHYNILDVGAGSGALSLPLAQLGHRVLALDFSEKMLAALTNQAAQNNIHSIETRHFDINCNWAAAGILPKSHDVVIASRSLMVNDLWQALDNLNATARKLVAITMATEYGPKALRRLGEEQPEVSSGSDNRFVPDFHFALGMLLQKGVYPELRYVENYRSDDRESSGVRLIRWAFISWEPTA